MDSISSLFPDGNLPDGRILVVRKNGKAYYQKRGFAPTRIPKGKKYCPHCEEVKEKELFTSKSGKFYAYCRECRNRKARASHTIDKGRNRFLLKNYGITKEEYDLMLFRQADVCAICGKPETFVHWRTQEVQPLSVDHNHATQEVRELLCNSCNQLVRIVEADQERMSKVMKYLKKHDT